MRPSVIADQLGCLGHGPVASCRHRRLRFQQQLALRIAGVAGGHLQGEHSEQSSQQEMVLVTLELPRNLVDWIDGLKAQMGFRSLRWVIVAQLIRELVAEVEQESTDEDTTQAA